MATQSPSSNLPAPVARTPVAALALLALVWLGALLLGGSGLDQQILRGVHVSERPWLLVALIVTRLGDWEVLLALPFFGSAWLMVRGRRRVAIFLLASAVAGRLLVELQKGFLGRLRPDEFDDVVVLDSFAYPSGHSANSMIVYLLLALLVAPATKRGWAVSAAVVLSVLIGISRVLLGVHWPTDVLGGWAFGLLWVALCLRLAGNWVGVNAR